MARRKTIALLLDYLGGDYQEGILGGVQGLAAERDVNLLTVVGRSLGAPRSTDAAQNEIYSRLSSASVDGLVIGAGCIGIYAGSERLTRFCQSFAPLPVVSIGACVPGVPSIVISNRRGMRTVLDHVIQVHGCRKVAYVRGPLESEEAEQRFQGYVDALEANGIAFVPELVRAGNFWINSGAEAAGEFVRAGLEFDAIVAANDYMALGVLDQLRSVGRRIPHEVLVAGFDDVPSSRTGFRSLTTVRQPLHVLGRTACDTLLRKMAGEEVPERVEHDVELVTRQSCGCAYRARVSVISSLPSHTGDTVLSELVRRSAELGAALEAAAAIPADAFGGWAARLLSALRSELEGGIGQFVLELEDILDEAQARAVVVDEFNAVIGVLRARFARLPLGGTRDLLLDDLWHAGILLIGAAASRNQSRQRTSSERAHDELRQGVERLSTAFDHETLKKVLLDILSSVGVSSACLSLYGGADLRTLSCLFAYSGNRELELSPQAFPAGELAPASFWPKHRWSHVIQPITFAGEQLGVMTIELGAPRMVYPMLREQIGASLKGAALHRAVIHETTRRERAERERLSTETVIARRLQTGLWPVDARVRGLEWSASTIPAYEVGGDYFDVLPTEGGCWICLGDVTGHGLVAGMLMAMLQSIVAGAIASNPRAQPAALVSALNPVFYGYVRGRLRLDDHASLVLIRYEHDGTLTFAGFHEELLIWRQARRSWERLETSGTWVGATPDLSHVTKDCVARLEVGDLLVLYTDGVTEAPNSSGDAFGIERLCETIGMRSDEPLDMVRDAVIEKVRHWSPGQRDDVTLVIVRRTADISEATAPDAGPG